jgi:hypothetical protein
MGCASSVQQATEPSFHNGGKETAPSNRKKSSQSEILSGPASVYRSVVPAPSLWLQSLSPNTVKVSWSHEAIADDSPTVFLLEIETGSGKGFLEFYRCEGWIVFNLISENSQFLYKSLKFLNSDAHHVFKFSVNSYSVLPGDLKINLMLRLSRAVHTDFALLRYLVLVSQIGAMRYALVQ